MMRGFRATVIALSLAWAPLAFGVPLPPAAKDLGLVNPTPHPTARAYEKKRIITTLTVQNTPKGETMVMFEATNFGDEGKGKTKILASERYTLTSEKPELRGRREQIINELRVLEGKLLEYVEVAGPPKEAPSEKPKNDRPYQND